MSDVAVLAGWLATVGAAVLACVAARRAGVPLTYLRDFVHVGAGTWPLLWPLWSGPWGPILLAIGGAALASAVPSLAGRAALLGRLRDSISDESERWSGIRLYGISVALATIAAFTFSPFPAAAALLALALGDGLGGLIGRRYGRRWFAAPGAKRKSLEGSVAVAAFSSLAVLLSMLRFSVPLAALPLVLGGIVASAAEALSPAGTDNLFVPASVWLTLSAVQGGA